MIGRFYCEMAGAIKCSLFKSIFHQEALIIVLDSDMVYFLLTYTEIQKKIRFFADSIETYAVSNVMS